MTSRTMKLALPALTLGLLAAARTGGAQAGGAPAQPAAHTTPSAASRQADEQAIRALSQRWLAAVRAKDVDGVMANFASDAVAVYGGRLLTGVAEIRRRQVEDLAETAKTRPGFVPSWQTTSVEVAQSGDLAYESGSYDDTWTGGKERGHYLTVWRKVGSDWKVVRDIAVPERKANEKTPAP